MERSKRMYGSTDLLLDDKGRIRIPAKFLAVLGTVYPEQPLYYVIYNEHRIAVMPECILDQKTEELNNISPNDLKAMNALSKILGSVEELTKDGQGRTVIPKTLKQEVGIDKEVVVVGMGDYFEVWAKAVHTETVGNMSRMEANETAYGRARELSDKS